MLNSAQFLKELTKDVQVDLTQAFDRNFESKSFFNQKWPAEKYANSRGSLMNRTGKLRRSIKSTNANGQISWSSNVPYASVHNEGLQVKGQRKIRQYTNKNFMGKGKSVKIKAHTRNVNFEMPQRQFIGWHPQVDVRIKKIVNTNLDVLNKEIIKTLKK